MNTEASPPSAAVPALQTPWWVRASWVVPVVTIMGNLAVGKVASGLSRLGDVGASLGRVVSIGWGIVFGSAFVFGVASLVSAVRHRRLIWALQGFVGIAIVSLFLLMAVVAVFLKRSS